MSGCVHDFGQTSSFMLKPRHSLVTCATCGAEATVGEVAWMLGGGQLVRIYHDMEEHRRTQLMELAGMPAQGGLH